MNAQRTLYIETTIPSYATSRKSKDEISAGKQKATKEFWETERQNFILVTSDYTILEVSRGDPEAAKKRRDWLAGITVLRETDEIISLATIYKKLLAIPDEAEMDCSHLAVCVSNRVDFLLTWNCTHLGPDAQSKVKAYNDTHGFWTPVFVTPDTIYSFIKGDV